jgi:hypothetical protein
MEESRRRVVGIAWCYSRVLGEIIRSTSLGSIIPFYGSPCLPYILRAWGRKWVVLNLGLLALHFSLCCLGIISVLLCLLARGQQNRKHSLTLLVQPGPNRQVMFAITVPSSGEPSPSFFDMLGSFFHPEGLTGGPRALPIMSFDAPSMTLTSEWPTAPRAMERDGGRCYLPQRCLPQVSLLLASLTH